MQSITINMPELGNILAQIIRKELESFHLQRAAKKNEDLITRKEAARKLKIDLSTLYLWTKDENIPLVAVKLGRKVYYRISENKILQ